MILKYVNDSGRMGMIEQILKIKHIYLWAIVSIYVYDYQNKDWMIKTRLKALNYFWTAGNLLQ